ncbi:MAG: PocR ligand-binding domain-containing protein [Acholeplasmataceae bacterium]|nr:PocR ligand-binding domain-containing protein [Acholeplasmataceae bacterium]
MRTNVFNFIDFNRFNSLLEGFNKSTGFVTAILDLEGNIISKSGWRTVCTNFHRVNPESNKNCLISDTILANKMIEGEKYHLYQCHNGLVDVAVPIKIQNEHVANLFTGQFFLEEPNYAFFKEQAKKYGFEETSYIDAIKKVPIVNKNQIKEIMDFLLNLTDMIIDLTLDKMEKENSEILLKSSLESPTDIIILAIDQNYNYLYYNQTHKNVMKATYNADVAIGSNLMEAISSDIDKVNAKKNYDLALSGKAHRTLQEYGDKHISYYETSYSPIYDKERNIIGATAFSRDISDIMEEKERSEKYLRELIMAGKIFETSIENAPVPIMIHAENGEVLNISQAWTQLTGYQAIDIPTIYDWTEKAYGQNKEDVIKVISKLYSLTEMQHDGEFTVTTKEGKERIWDFYSMCIGNIPDGRAVVMSIAIDITLRKKAESELANQQDLMSYVIEHSNAGVAVHDRDLNYIYVSKKYLDQYEVHEDVIGKHHYAVFPDLPQKWRDVHRRTLEGETISGDRDLYERSDGTKLWTRWESRPWVNEKGEISGLIIYSEVINKEVEVEEQRIQLLIHDQLTGLYNRSHYESLVKILYRKENYPISLVNFDINGLILINEAFGHEKGNEFLCFVSKTLRDVFCEKCMIFRVGGDQFVVISMNSSKEKVTNYAKTVSEMVKVHSINGIQLSIAYGVATADDIDESIDQLFIRSENEMYSNKIFESQSYRNQSIQSLITAYHEKNPREEEHSQRVSELCEIFGKALNMDQDNINKLKAISYLHDIGKISIDEAILNKPGKLNDQEWAMIRKHPEMGARIISSSDEYKVIADDILSHHEHYDGHGYPRGLKGEDIPLRARMIAIIDSYDAMTQDRPYRKALSQKEAIEELYRCSGTQFDSGLVEVFVKKVIRFDDFNL